MPLAMAASSIILPLPFIRSIGIGGMLIPAVSVLASTTDAAAELDGEGAADEAEPARAGNERLEHAQISTGSDPVDFCDTCHRLPR